MGGPRMVQDNSAAWEPARDADNTFEMVQEINAGSPNIKVMGIGGGGVMRSVACSKTNCR